MVTNANRLVASLQYARSEAAKRNSDVSLKPRAGSWRNGFLVATNELDFDGDGKCNANTIEDACRIFEGTAKSMGIEVVE